MITTAVQQIDHKTQLKQSSQIKWILEKEEFVTCPVSIKYQVIMHIIMYITRFH